MSTSLLYHAFCIRGYVYLATQYCRGRVLFRIRREPSKLRCPVCQSLDVIRRGTVRRQFHSLPIGKRPVDIQLDVQRVQCRNCRCVRQEQLGFADPHRRHTRAFERYVVELSKSMTMLDIARHLQVGWDTVKDIIKRHLSRRFRRIRLRDLRLIAIDEITIGKGHKYLTIVLDLVSGAVVFVGEGKGADALDRFWKRLRSSKARIEAVAIDMSPAYIQAVSAHLPQATVVFDHFHIIKLFNDKLSDLRRELYREATDKLHKDTLKGTRWLLLKAPENLDESRNEPARLAEALQLNEPLATAYYLKEDLRQLWAQQNKAQAQAFLDGWLQRAQASGIKMLARFAQTLAAHRTGILAYYDFPISTGPLEGTNNKIKTLKRQAYGFRDHEFFKLRILAIHEAKYALVG